MKNKKETIQNEEKSAPPRRWEKPTFDRLSLFEARSSGNPGYIWDGNWYYS